MLGVLKSGAAYVPVDPAAPAQRVGFILKDCAVSAVVTVGRKLAETAEFFRQIPELRMIVLADAVAAEPPRADIEIMSWHEATGNCGAVAPEVGAIESDPAYLLYTSGSTGTPKGVVLSHRHALTFVDWGQATFEVGTADILSNHAPLHFDLSVFDIYVALQAGACVKILPDNVAPFARELARWIEAEGITVWYSVPSALVRLLMHGEPERFEYAKLRVALFAGEVFPVKYLHQIMQRWRNARFYNLYGPTETNVCTFFAVPSDLPLETGEIPIGAPCANTNVFALTDSGTVATIGESGELYVRGPALLSGYWKRSEKTREMLVQNPLAMAYPEMTYRTGDIVRVDEHGRYWFIGRRDHLVKCRGYRIELGEIEQVLYQHADIKEVVIVAVRDEEVGARLHAFLAATSSSLNDKDLQEFIGARLPKYMIPEVFHFERELPKTSTGKIDRLSLAQRLTETKT